MKINITLNKQHFYDFQKYTINKINGHDTIKSKAILFNFLYWFLLVFSVIGIINVYYYQECWTYKHFNIAVIGLVIWFVLANVWHYWYMKLFTMAAVDENGYIIGTHEIEFSEEGITTKKEHTQFFMSWKAVQTIEKNQDQLYLYIDNAQALIIPLDQVKEDLEEIITQYSGKTANDDKLEFL